MGDKAMSSTAGDATLHSKYGESVLGKSSQVGLWAAVGSFKHLTFSWMSANTLFLVPCV